MRLKRKIDWDVYFNFLEDYFSLFDFNEKLRGKRKKIIGDQFKL